MRQEERQGRQGRQEDGSAKTREVKLGAVFTQPKLAEKGRPMRDHASTTEVGSFQSAAAFALRLRDEARRRAVGAAPQVILLSDGAAWAEATARPCFAGAVRLLDFYHTAQRVHKLAVLVCSADKPRASRWIKLLLKGAGG